MADDIAEAKVRRIVVAVDESEESTYALQWCLQNLIKGVDVKGVDVGRGTVVLLLLYARPPPPVYAALDSTGYMFQEQVITAMDRYSVGLANSVLEKAENICKSYGNIKVQVKTRMGDARKIICDMVEELAADLLVMGSHGYGFIKRALLGSVSDHCVRNVKCPVLIVKSPTQQNHRA